MATVTKKLHNRCKRYYCTTNASDDDTEIKGTVKLYLQSL